MAPAAGSDSSSGLNVSKWEDVRKEWAGTDLEQGGGDVSTGTRPDAMRKTTNQLHLGTNIVGHLCS